MWGRQRDGGRGRPSSSQAPVQKDGYWWRPNPKQWFNNTFQTLGWPMPLYSTRFDSKTGKHFSTVILPEVLGHHISEFITVDARTVVGEGRNSKKAETACADVGCQMLARHGLLASSQKDLNWKGRSILKDSKSKPQLELHSASLNAMGLGGMANGGGGGAGAMLAAAGGDNPKSTLSQLCIRYAWDMPLFDGRPARGGGGGWRVRTQVPPELLGALEALGFATDWGLGRGVVEKASGAGKREAEAAAARALLGAVTRGLAEAWWLETPKQDYHNAVQSLMRGRKATFSVQSTGRGQFVAVTYLPEATLGALQRAGVPLAATGGGGGRGGQGRVEGHHNSKKGAETRCAAEACRLLQLAGQMGRGQAAGGYQHADHAAGGGGGGGGPAVHPFAVPFPAKHSKGPGKCDKRHGFRFPFLIEIPTEIETRLETLLERVPGVLDRGGWAALQASAPYPPLMDRGSGLDFFGAHFGPEDLQAQAEAQAVLDLQQAQREGAIPKAGAGHTVDPRDYPKKVSKKWEQHYDAATTSTYYYNVETGETQWENPIGITEHVDAATGRKYFYNAKTQQSVWADADPAAAAAASQVARVNRAISQIAQVPGSAPGARGPAGADPHRPWAGPPLPKDEEGPPLPPPPPAGGEEGPAPPPRPAGAAPYLEKQRKKERGRSGSRERKRDRKERKKDRDRSGSRERKRERKEKKRERERGLGGSFSSGDRERKKAKEADDRRGRREREQDAPTSTRFDQAPGGYLDGTPLVRGHINAGNPALLPRLQAELQQYLSRQRTPAFLRTLEKRKELPAYKRYEEVMATVKTHQVSLISGATGCGKTTQVPQFILDDLLVEAAAGRRPAEPIVVLVTQPRQIAATSVAQRVAQERGEGLGGSVGYQIRLQKVLPQATAAILFCTTGVVLRKFAGDSLLSRVSHLVVDEVHERDLDSDFLLVLLRDLLPRRPDLKVTLMSATMDAHQFAEYFERAGLRVPLLELEGRAFPVEEFYLDDVLEHMVDATQLQRGAHRLNTGSARFGGKHAKGPSGGGGGPAWARAEGRRTKDFLAVFDEDDLPVDLAALIIEAICENRPVGEDADHNSAILVFMPGMYEIRELDKVLRASPGLARHRTLIIPLHSQLNQQYQKDVFDRPPAGVRKIVISTNIAESSITIDDVVYVIDSARLKQKSYDHETRISSLESVWGSRATLKQRAGRAGRVAPGVCYHLCTRWRASQLEAQGVPEMQRVALEDLALTIKALNIGDVMAVLGRAMQAPSPESIQDALQVLRGIGALDEENQITLLGQHLAKLPIEPRTGKMIILGVIFKCLDPLLTIAAAMSGKDPFVVPLHAKEQALEAKKRLAAGHSSDHLALVQAYAGWEQSMAARCEQQFLNVNFLSGPAMNNVMRVKAQFFDILKTAGFAIEDAFWQRGGNRSSLRQNQHQGNFQLIKGVLAAGLSPNIFRVIDKGTSGKLMTVDNCEIGPRQQSVLKGEGHEALARGQRLGVFQEKFKAKSVYLDCCTAVSPLTLLLFADRPVAFDPPRELRRRLPPGRDPVGLVVDGWVSFVAERKAAGLVLGLRAAVDALLVDTFGESASARGGRSSSRGGGGSERIPTHVADALVDLVSDLLHLDQENEVVEEMNMSLLPENGSSEGGNSGWGAKSTGGGGGGRQLMEGLVDAEEEVAGYGSVVSVPPGGNGAGNGYDGVPALDRLEQVHEDRSRQERAQEQGGGRHSGGHQQEEGGRLAQEGRRHQFSGPPSSQHVPAPRPPNQAPPPQALLVPMGVAAPVMQASGAAMSGANGSYAPPPAPTMMGMQPMMMMAQQNINYNNQQQQQPLSYDNQQQMMYNNNGGSWR